MSCGCRGRQAVVGGETLGYIVILPDGTQKPPVGSAPFFSVIEARTEVRAAGGGTIKRITTNGS